LTSFQRGVTQYPLPGALVFPATTADLRRIYSGDGRATVAIGRVHPTRDINASLYVDPLLGKHFALLGSTGTGKSTALALILHRICEASPHGHILMIDPHGEYASAFRHTGLILDVSNLQLPYWLMNFEEHCEILLSSKGENRQMDAEILRQMPVGGAAEKPSGRSFGRADYGGFASALSDQRSSGDPASGNGQAGEIHNDRALYST
jgi:hypothetical protein